METATERWKKWECPLCREVYDDPEYTYQTTCTKGHMVILGSTNRDELWTWAELDDHFYSKKELDSLKAMYGKV